MQLNKYIKFMVSTKVPDLNNQITYLNGIRHFIDHWNFNKIKPEGLIEHIEFLLPSESISKKRDQHYYIIYAISRSLRVKVMWRDIIDTETGEVINGIWIIGQKPLINLTQQFLEHYFNYYYYLYANILLNFSRNKRGTHYMRNRRYASSQLSSFEESAYLILMSKLEADRKYELFLENVIKVLYKLDYKKYRTNNQAYYHAISKHYHHKRMLL